MLTSYLPLPVVMPKEALECSKTSCTSGVTKIAAGHNWKGTYCNRDLKFGRNTEKTGWDSMVADVVALQIITGGSGLEWGCWPSASWPSTLSWFGHMDTWEVIFFQIFQPHCVMETWESSCLYAKAEYPLSLWHTPVPTTTAVAIDTLQIRAFFLVTIS